VTTEAAIVSITGACIVSPRIQTQSTTHMTNARVRLRFIQAISSVRGTVENTSVKGHYGEQRLPFVEIQSIG